ncbi:hypothetical protein VPH35_139310 [Triticum aestivum]
MLEAFPKDKAWELFCNTAFPGDTNHKCPKEMTKLAHQVASKCKGIPLAIVSIGRLLFRRDKTKEELKRIHDQLNWELFNNPSLEHVRNILYLSYIYLPTHLKSCFLYCSLFPEDYLMRRKKLIRLWVAEGFIERRGESTMEEVAEGYLKELVHRNMLQLVQKNSFGRMKSFRIHDIMHELAVDLCQKECFGGVYEGDKHTEYIEEKDGRRLVIHKLKKGIYQSPSNLHRLRSLIALDIGTPSSSLLPLIVGMSRYMSVLELSGLPIENVPDAIEDLFNLRHLGLRGSKVKVLPKSVEKLTNLLTLDLFGSDRQELPRGIVKLKNLRHLLAERVYDATWAEFRSASGVRIPRNLGNLTNLQTLNALDAQDESLGCLGELRQLRSFRIWNVKGIYCGRLCESLVQMQFLSVLSVNASDKNEVLQLNALPPNLKKLRLTGRLAEGTLCESLFQAVGQNLYSLHLYWSELKENPLPSLSQMSNMTDLDLTSAYTGEELIFLSGWFPNLKTLFLRDLPNLKLLEFKKDAMASLERLILINLNSMTEVPPGIEFLGHLKKLSFAGITPDFLMLLRQCSRIGRVRWQHSLRH